MILFSIERCINASQNNRIMFNLAYRIYCKFKNLEESSKPSVTQIISAEDKGQNRIHPTKTIQQSPLIICLLPVAIKKEKLRKQIIQTHCFPAPSNNNPFPLLKRRNISFLVPLGFVYSKCRSHKGTSHPYPEC